ncbi:MAG: rpfC [Fibrobacteres bacterium]|nr:rpfC [Fibrobacterota bacterium]
MIENQSNRKSLPAGTRASAGAADWIRSAIAAGAYALISFIGIHFTSGIAGTTAFFPVSGVLLAMAVLCPPGRRTKLFLLAFLGSLAAHAMGSAFGTGAGGFALAPGLAASKILEVLIAERLMRRMGIGPGFLNDLRKTVLFLAVAGPIAAAVSGLAAAAMIAALTGAPITGNWLSWWMSHTVGLAVLTPAILSWRTQDLTWSGNRFRHAEGIAAVAAVSAAAYAIFAHWQSIWGPFGHPMPMATLPLLLWGALRLGVRGSANLHLIVLAISAYYTSKGIGPFIDLNESPIEILASIQIFNFTMAFCSILPAIMLHSHLRLHSELRDRIGDLKKAQNDLRESENLFRSLMDSNIIGVAIVGADEAYEEANDAFLGITGYGRADLGSGRLTVRMLQVPENDAGYRSIMERLRTDGKIDPQEGKYLRKDGSVVPIYRGVTRLADGIRFLVVAMDLTRMKEVQTALLRSERLFRTLAEASLVGTLRLDMRGECVYANPKWLSMAGLSESGVLGTGWRKAVHEEDRGRLRAAWDAFLAGGAPVIGEYRLLRPDGTVTWVSGWSTGLFDDDGSNLGYLEKSIDITEQMRAKAELESAKQSAENANQAKSRFLTHMSHEIRTPLNGVMGMVSMLSRSSLTPEQRSYADVARQSGEHLLSLINQVLDFSKIESGNLELQAAEFSLGIVVETAIAAVTENAQKKGLEILTEWDPGLQDRYLGDSLRLQQVLLNLLGNAVKFSDQGEIRLSIRKRSEAAEESELLFEVTDQGPGIPDGIAARIFQPFRQGDPSLSRKAGGTGLGLAISKDLATRMGGDLWLEKGRETGSRFRFTVRLQSATPAAMEPQEDGTDTVTAWISDSHPASSLQLSEWFLKWGYRVEQCPIGEDLLVRLETAYREGTRPSVIIVSISGESGEEIPVRLLEGSRRMGIPVFFSVPFISQAQGTGYLRAGAAGLLTKPFRASSILASIREAVPGRAKPGISRRNPEDDRLATALNPDPRILVVDDHPTNLLVASTMLSKLGCGVDRVSNGTAAIKAIQTLHYDVVLMDCQMPGLDGFETTARIRALPAPMGRIPIVALTAHAVDGVREKCLAAGMDDYLAKPFSLEALHGTLRQWIGSRNHGRASAGIDWTRLEAFDDGTPNGRLALRKLIALFLDASRSDLASIREHVLAERPQDLARSLHRLKGGCGTVGAIAMTEQLKLMESSLAEADIGAWAGLPGMLERLETEFGVTGTLLQAKMPRD